MSNANLFRLVVLSAIWGASFMFMRIGAPVLGPTLLIEFRVALAALFLLVVGLVLKKALHVRQHWQHYLLLGLFNSALPFLLFAYAAQTITASLLSILNATAPIWGAVIAAVWTKTPLTARASLGLALGIAGVAVLAGFDKVTLLPGAGLAIAAALGASFCYGISSVYAKSAKSVEPFANAHGSMWAATLLIAPAVPFFPAAQVASPAVIGSVIALGILCSGVAYLLYFRLIADIGAAPALTVTFLIPVFGIIWGYLFLNEAIGWHTIAGSIVVIAGTALVTGFSLDRLFQSKPRPPPAPPARR